MKSYPSHWPAETKRIMQLLPEKGVFLTGIEGSDPVVKGKRRDLLQEAGDFYTNYRERLERIRGLGITWLRLGPPYSKVHLAEDKYDFSWFDQVIKQCQDLGITVQLDLLHFGIPDWQHKDQESLYFQNPEFPKHFARYVDTIVRRYPHITWFTPVNEPQLTATFSAKVGLWNESQASDQAYVAAASAIAEAAILARQTIERIWQEENRSGEPLFLQNESFEWALSDPEGKMSDEAELFNRAYRFTLLDLILGHRDEDVKAYLLSRGMSEERYEWFMKQGSTKGTILGIDFYPTCVHVFYPDHAEHYDATMPYELYRLVVDYWARYPLPLIHTEVNAQPDHALSICQQTYDELNRLRKEGYPVAGMAWYGDESQVDWHTALASIEGEEYPVGLFRQGKPQPVAQLFSNLAKQGFTNTLT